MNGPHDAIFLSHPLGQNCRNFKPMGHYGTHKGQIKVNRLGFTPQENDRMQPAAEYGRR